jgi:hypothetical protein
MTVGMWPESGQSEVRGGRHGRLEHQIVAAPRQRDAHKEIRRHQPPHNLEQGLETLCGGEVLEGQRALAAVSPQHAVGVSGPVFLSVLLATTQKVPLSCGFLVELRGLEPRHHPAKQALSRALCLSVLLRACSVCW